LPAYWYSIKNKTIFIYICSLCNGIGVEIVDDILIEVSDVSMLFNLNSERIDTFKEYVIKLIKKEFRVEQFTALYNISFTLRRGESLGILGLNGSGKSTLLKIVAGVLKPTSGTVTVNGSISPLLELGSSFDNNLSAKENTYLNGAFLGFSHKQIDMKYDEIIGFAEIKEFENVPITNYSSGMRARLGFSIATAFISDILIVDEVLSVGDHFFKEKCEAKLEEMLSKGTTLLFVSHSIEQVKRICSKCLWINKGEMVMYGDSDIVCKEYMSK